MQELIKKSINILNKKGIILSPTDTVWGLCCDATINQPVKKIIKIKGNNNRNGFIVLMDSIAMLQIYVTRIPAKALSIINNHTHPVTIIYQYKKGLSKHVTGNDNKIAVRIPKHIFLRNLINKFGKPILSTSANISGKVTPKKIEEIEPYIFHNIDFIVDEPEIENGSGIQSTILEINDLGEIKILR